MSRAPSSSEASKYPPTEFSLKYTKVSFVTSGIPSKYEKIIFLIKRSENSYLHLHFLHTLFFYSNAANVYMKEFVCHKMTLLSAHLSTAPDIKRETDIKELK